MTGEAILARTLKPCGPVVDAGLAERTFEVLDKAAAASGWSDLLDAARAALAPVFGASPYLAGLARRRPAQIAALLAQTPADARARILAETDAVAADAVDIERVKQRLRELKAQLHLLTALADLGGLWDLDQVTGALTEFADAALRTAMAAAAQAEVERGRLTTIGTGVAGPVPGLFCVAMGKYGAFELNYSSDIDFSVFYDPDVLPLAEGVEYAAFAIRYTQAVAEVLQQRTGDGYVFRVDLRLRPDP